MHKNPQTGQVVSLTFLLKATVWRFSENSEAFTFSFQRKFNKLIPVCKIINTQYFIGVIICKEEAVKMCLIFW